MLTDLIYAITNFITSTIGALGYPGVALLMAIESAAIPLPSEIIMPFAGFLVNEGRFSLFGLAMTGAVGSVIGSTFIYAIAYYGGRPLIYKYGHWVLVTHHDLELAENFFKRFGKWASFFGRMIPVVRTFISVPAGLCREKFSRFIIGAFIGSFVWSYFLAWLGVRLGENWHSLETYFRKFDFLFLAILIIFAIYWIRRHIKHRVK